MRAPPATLFTALSIMRGMRSSFVWAVVVLVHIGAIYLLTTGMRSHAVQQDSAERQGELIFIVTEARRIKQLPRVTRAPTAAKQLVRNSLSVDSEDSNSVSASDNAINWTKEASTALAMLLVRQQGEAARRSLDSKPAVIELPKGDAPHQLGDSQRFDDGELITWISDQCYVSNRPLVGPQLDPERLNKVCKDPSKPQDDLFDVLRPKYLGGPKAPPTEEQKHQREKCPTLCE